MLHTNIQVDEANYHSAYVRALLRPNILAPPSWCGGHVNPISSVQGIATLVGVNLHLGCQQMQGWQSRPWQSLT